MIQISRSHILWYVKVNTHSLKCYSQLKLVNIFVFQIKPVRIPSCNATSLIMNQSLILIQRVQYIIQADFAVSVEECLPHVCLQNSKGEREKVSNL